MPYFSISHVHPSFMQMSQMNGFSEPEHPPVLLQKHVQLHNYTKNFPIHMQPKFCHYHKHSSPLQANESGPQPVTILSPQCISIPSMWLLPFRSPIHILHTLLISPTQAMCYIPILFSCCLQIPTQVNILSLV